MGAVNYEVYVILIVFNLPVIQFILKKILNLILISYIFFGFLKFTEKE